MAALLLLPLVAMQLTDEVDWSAGDFAVFGAMLLVAGGTFEAAARLKGTGVYLAAAGVALAAAFVLVWMNLAVGIIGSEDNPANLMFGAVLAIGIVGAIAARFQAEGMARALCAAALAQASVGVVALVAGPGAEGPIRPIEVLLLTGLFAALWLLSVWLFRRAAREQAPRPEHA